MSNNSNMSTHPNASTPRRHLVRGLAVGAMVAVLVVVAWLKMTSGGGTGSADASLPVPVITKFPRSYPPLEAAVKDYFSLIAEGHKYKAYGQAVSDRCRRQE